MERNEVLKKITDAQAELDEFIRTEAMRKGITWQDIRSAPRDGTPFVNFYLITVVGVDHKVTYEPHAQVVRRVKSHPESSGFWMAEYTSVPDHSLHGVWSPLPFTSPR